MTQEELNKILENHKHWIREDCEGWKNMRAYLSGAYLTGADLTGAYLTRAYLTGAYLSGADLRRADLTRAYLTGADLTGTDLRGADLTRAYLTGADLSGADLRGADLSGADLRGANLTGADLTGAKNVPFIPMMCPDEGEFTGWKKVNNGTSYLIKLLIPAEAKRSSATGRKCRCEFADVVQIIRMNDGAEVDEVENTEYSPHITYRKGKRVYPDSFDEDRWNECSHGIHFFINKQEAVDY